MLDRYGPEVGDHLSCERLSEGLLNRGYRLTTTRGRFFLKHHLNGTPEAIERQHRTSVQLGLLGVPVAPPLVTDSGTTVVLDGGRCYALHPWVDSQHRDGSQLSTEEAAELGGLLGRVHNRLPEAVAAATSPRAAHAAGGPPRSGRLLPRPRHAGASGAGRLPARVGAAPRDGVDPSPTPRPPHTAT
ncbi:phosphotransferase, partial [Streptomyces durbertensis]|nr:phosphotransferase [Streptomyces durbertensis]